MAVMLLVGWLVILGVSVARAPARERLTSSEGRSNREHLSSARAAAPPGPEIVSLYRGHTASFWAGQFRHRTRQLQNARRVLHTDPHVVEAINLACATYGYCSTLWRKADCETGGTYSATAHNPSGASGLFQFLGSTWATTPYRMFSIWSPYASALAAGWMHVQGRGGEWVCQ